MDTPGSADDGWNAQAEIHSGRPNPSWPLQREDAAALIALWDGLAPFRGAPPRPPPLGYRGCRVTRGSQELFAYGGAVASGTGAHLDVRADAAGAFERLVLESAPAGVIPANLPRT